MRSKSIVLFALCLALTFASHSFAQTTSSSIAGSVVDQQGAAIPNARVSATEQTRNFTLNTVTDSQGRFVFPQAQPGSYNVTVEAEGFKKFEQQNLTVYSNQKISVGKLVLEVGQISQSVEVTASNVQLQTESGERSQTLNSKQIQSIAINGRSYLPLVALTPGVTTYPDLQTAGHGGVGSISANGARQNQNNLTLDGIGDVDTGNNGDQLATISLDSVQEFRVLTSNYQAEYGRSAGAQISVVTKSGTSDFHGSGYIYHRNEGLNANNWMNNRDGLPRKLYRYNDAGYTIGGPIYIPKVLNTNKDKFFFFFSQEYQEQLKPQDLHRVTVPTALERTGDFSQSVDKNGNPFPYIRDYSTGLPCNSTNIAGCYQYGGVLGRIDPTKLSALGLNILKAYPLPNAQSAGNQGFNYQSQISDSYPRREDLLRGDWNINSKNKAFVRWINNSDAVTSYYGSFVLGTNIPKVPITDARPGKALGIGLTSILNATTTNEFTWGFGKNIINIDPVNDGLSREANNLTGLPNLYPLQNDYIPSFGFNGTRLANTGAWGTNNAPFYNYNTTIEFVDNLSKVIGQHVVKVGFYAQRSRKDQTSFASSAGSYDFGDTTSNPYDTGFGFANAALGIYNTYSQASQYATGLYRYSNIEWYGQDTWKVTKNFTLDYGMRFYWIQPQFDAALQTSTFLPQRYNPAAAPRLYQPVLGPDGAKLAQDPATGQTLPAYAIGKIVPNSGNLLNGIAKAGTQYSKYLMKDRGIQYSPRFGFAWDVTGKSNIVVRGGGAILYDRYQGNLIFDELTNPPTTFAPTLTYGLINQISPTSALLGPSGLTTLDPNGENPTIANYSLGVQMRLPASFILDTSYVGNRAWHLQQKLNLNAIPYGATFLPQNQDPTAGNPSQPGAGALPRDFLRPYPGYGDIGVHEAGGTSNYNSLQVSLNRDFSKGLLIGVAYTYGKALGTSSGDGDYNRIDGLERFANYGPLTFDRRHTVAINAIYQFPSIFKRGILHTIVDGWQISDLTRFQTGAPYDVNFSLDGWSNQNLTGSYTEGPRTQVVGDPKAGTNDSPYQRLNAGAFAPPPVGNIGLGEGRYPFYGPGINDTDLSLSKTFRFKERFGIELRAEAVNAFNHPQFGGVGGDGVSNNSGIHSTVNYSGDPSNYSVKNAFLNSSGGINNINGFGTVSGARDPRIMLLSATVSF
jgi:hypothetical protein